MKPIILIRTTALIGALITVFTTTAAAMSLRLRRHLREHEQACVLNRPMRSPKLAGSQK